jgi:hypothetical protein
MQSADISNLLSIDWMNHNDIDIETLVRLSRMLCGKGCYGPERPRPETSPIVPGRCAMRESFDGGEAVAFVATRLDEVRIDRARQLVSLPGSTLPLTRTC